MPKPQSKSKARNPKRRWFRHSVRALIVVMTAAALWIGYLANCARRQEQAVARVTQLGGQLEFAHQSDSEGNRKKDAEPWAPAWLRDAIGEHCFLRVEVVSFREESDPADEDLVVLAGLPDLRMLSLGNRQRITDKGLIHISGLRQLRELALNGTAVTGSGLRHIRGCRELQALFLGHTPVTDQGLAHLKGLSSLRWLLLNHTKVTDRGLVHLAHLESLQDLELANTSITDEGLRHLEQLTWLEHVWLQGTDVTVKGCARLEKAIPGCEVSH